MNQSTHSDPTPHTVSTVTKHIKIYSDNPIHDCIDRIIDCSARIDEGIGDSIANFRELKKVSADLNRIAHKSGYNEIQKREAQLNGERPN